MRNINDRDDAIDKLRYLLGELCSPDMTLTRGKELHSRLSKLREVIEESSETAETERTE